MTDTMTTPETTTEEEQRQRTLAVLKRMVAEKRVREQEDIEAYKNDPELQAIFAKLREENTNCDDTSKL